jgi:anti-anti-sigma factor
LEPTAFGIEHETTDGVQVVSVRGELDLATAPQLRDLLDDELAGEMPVLIDLTSCEFIDSTGIAVIVRAWQRRRGVDGDSPSGGLLGLCGPDKQVSRLLEVTGVDTSIPVFGDCDEAVRQVSQGSEQSG